MPMLQMRKQKLGEMKETVQGYLASEWQTWDLIPGLSDSKTHILSLCHTPQGRRKEKETTFVSKDPIGVA